MAQFTTGYGSPPSKPSVGNTMRKIGKGIANYFGRDHTINNVKNFQKTLVKYIYENTIHARYKLNKLDIWALRNDNVPRDWGHLIKITQEENKMYPPEGRYRQYKHDIIKLRINWLKWCVSERL